MKMIEIGDVVWVRDEAMRQYSVARVLRTGIDSHMNPYADFEAFWNGAEYRFSGDRQSNMMLFTEWNPARKNPHFVLFDELGDPPVLSTLEKDRLARAADPARRRTDDNLRSVFQRKRR